MSTSKVKEAQRIAAIAESRLIEMPKPIEQLDEGEVERKRCMCGVMTYALGYLTSEFVDSGFEWLLPVIFSKTTDPLWPDPGASIEKRIEVEIYGTVTRTTQSMIVHKMVACSLVQPRLFVLSPNVRIENEERASSGMHVYEFTQLDFEVRNATSREVRSFVERVLSGLVSSVKNCLSEELMYLGRNDDLMIHQPPFRIYDRRELQHEFGKDWETRFTHEIYDPAWVTNIPREFYDFEDFEEGTWDNYDLIVPKYGEVLSGARREWKHHKLVQKMQRDNIRQKNFELLLKLAKERRLKPTAGAGIGVERLVSWLAGARHIGETQLFPKIPGLVYDL